MVFCFLTSQSHEEGRVVFLGSRGSGHKSSVATTAFQIAEHSCLWLFSQLSYRYQYSVVIISSPMLSATKVNLRLLWRDVQTFCSIHRILSMPGSSFRTSAGPGLLPDPDLPAIHNDSVVVMAVFLAGLFFWQADPVHHPPADANSPLLRCQVVAARSLVHHGHGRLDERLHAVPGGRQPAACYHAENQ